VDEADAMVVATLGAPTQAAGYTVAAAPANAATVTVTDDDVAGVTVTAMDPDPLVASENAGTATYSLVLTSEPTGEVTVTPSSNPAGVFTLSPTELVFTGGPTGNWGMAQTFTVTGIDDSAVNDPQRVATISHTVSGYRTADGSVAPAASVTVRSIDDDVPGVTLSVGMLDVGEAGGTGTWTVRLNTRPTGTVTVTPSIAPAGVAMISSPLTFTTDNWSMAQELTATGIDDQVDNASPRTATVSHTASGGEYGSADLTAATVAVTLTDDDAAGVALSVDMLGVNEAGGTATYTAVLTSRPLGNVTVTPSSNAEGVATVSGPLVFTTTNWETHQTVTVTGVDDQDANRPARTATVSHAVVGGSGGDSYATVSAGTVTVRSIDDDVPGVTLSVSMLDVGEAGGTATWTVRLNTRPTGTVMVVPSSGDETIATVSGALIFTRDNWRVPQTATATGVNDDIDNRPDRTVTLSHTASGADYGSADLTAATVTVTARDDDEAGVSVTSDGTMPLTTASVTEAEVRNTANWLVQLTSEPTAAVTVTPSSGDTSVATVSGALIFTAANWDMAQAVTVTGIDDMSDNRPDRMTMVTHEVSGGGSGDGYASVSVAGSVTVTVEDDDDAGATVSRSTVRVTEASGSGGTATWTVVLDTMPAGEVTVRPSSGDTSIATVLPAALTFTAANWSAPQAVTATGVDDDADNPGNERTVTVSHAAASTDDTNYHGVDISPVTVTVEDDDVPMISIMAETDSVPEGMAARFTLTADPVPGRDLTVALNVSVDSDEVLSGTPPTTATVRMGETSVTIDVATVDDDANEEDATVTATLTPPASGAGYGLGTDSATVTVTDDDEPGVMVTASDPFEVDENDGAATYAIRLTSEPSAEVTVTPSSNTDAVMISDALTFTGGPGGNWRTAQLVTVTGVDDRIDSDRTATISHAATSSDSDYEGIDVVGVTVMLRDDDTAGVTVSASGRPVLAIEGRTATWAVTLTSEPAVAVTVTPSSSDTGAVTVSGALTFTGGATGNWVTAQTVTVTGAEDAIMDGAERSAAISHEVTVSDTNDAYASVTVASVTVRSPDNDVAGLTLSSEGGNRLPAAGLRIDENGGTGTYTLVLNMEPTGPVTVTPSVGMSPQVAAAMIADPAAADGEPGTVNSRVAAQTSDDSDGEEAAAITVSPMALTFTQANWYTPQTVTVTGIDDRIVGERRVMIFHDASGGGYMLTGRAPVTVTLIDDDAGLGDRAVGGLEHGLGAIARVTGWNLVETIRNRSRGGSAGATTVVNAPGLSLAESGDDSMTDPFGRGIHDGRGNIEVVEGADLSDLLDAGTEIAVTLNPSQGGDDPSSAFGERPPNARAWMSGSRTDFDSRPFEGRTQDGEVLAAHIGLDMSFDNGWTVGNAIGIHDARVEFDDSVLEISGGSIDTEMTSFIPYASFARDDLRVWGALGGGFGALRYRETVGGPVASSRLRMLMAAAGVEYTLGTTGPFDLTGRGEGMFVDLKAKGSAHPVVGYDEVGVKVHGIRGELEIGLPRLRFGGAEIRPYALAGWRRDGGDVGTGNALEYGGGVNLRAPDLQMDVSVRTQSGGSDGDSVDMTGWSLSLEYDRGSDGKGLTLSFGRSEGPSDYDPWGGDPLSSFDPDDAEGTMRLHVGHGTDVGAGSLVPYAEADWRGSDLSSVGTGVRYEFRGGSAGAGYVHTPVDGDDVADHEVSLRARFEF